jgi:hypothetical protein
VAGLLPEWQTRYRKNDKPDEKVGADTTKNALRAGNAQSALSKKVAEKLQTASILFCHYVN